MAQSVPIPPPRPRKNADDIASSLWHHDKMTNRIAAWLAALLILAIALDVTLFDSRHLLFLGRKVFILLDWMAFWR